MTGTDVARFTYKQSRSYLNHLVYIYIYIYIYLLTASGLTTGGNSTVHIYTQTMHRTTQFSKNAGRIPSLRIIAWYLPYN